MSRNKIVVIAVSLIVVVCLVAGINAILTPPKSKLIVGAWIEDYEERGLRIKVKGKEYINFSYLLQITFSENGTMQRYNEWPGTYYIDGDKLSIHDYQLQTFPILELSRDRLILAADHDYEGTPICYILHHP